MQGVSEDRRTGPKSSPGNKLTGSERRRVLRVANSREYRDLSPKQIVPLLADRGKYVASESTFYRVLRETQQMTRRGPARVPQKRARPHEFIATRPREVWTWDITYLKSPVRGSFYYLYMILDVWSRKIVAAEVFEEEHADHSARLIRKARMDEVMLTGPRVLHSDNGSPMKGATMVATLEKLGILASFSRPRVSDDNPFSEALFRTVKYRPEYPQRGFASLEAARKWVQWFVSWYNEKHLHSAIGYVTPLQRHTEDDIAILGNRKAVYKKARSARPDRWSGKTRDWSRTMEVYLNPESRQSATTVA